MLTGLNEDKYKEQALMRKFVGLLVLVCAGWAGSVNASLIMYGLTSSSQGTLYSFDTSTGVSTYVGDPSFGYSSGLANISPVPLPAAAWLFISAIAGLAGAKRLSRSKGSA